MEMKRTGLRLTAALVACVAVLLAVAAHTAFVLASVPRGGVLFGQVLEDPEVQEQLGRIVFPDGHKASFKHPELRTRIGKDLHAAWRSWLDGRQAIGDLRINLRETRGLLVALRVPGVSVPGALSFNRLAGLTARDQRLLTTVRRWLSRLGDAAWVAAGVALLLFFAGFFLAPERSGYLVLPAFLFTVISLTVALFILLFRQQVLGLAQAALEQVSRNTPLERALVREGLGLVMERLLWLHLPGALVSGTALLLLQFRKRGPAVPGSFS